MLSIVPTREMMASMTTVPSTWAALAMVGYSGWMGAMRLPADTPEEIGRGFDEDPAAGATVTDGLAGAAAELMPGGRDEWLSPMFRTGSGGASTAGPVS